MWAMSAALLAAATVVALSVVAGALVAWILFCVERWIDKPVRMFAFAFAPIILGLWLALYRAFSVVGG